MQCNPKNTECADIYFEYQYWTWSADGERCAAEMKDARLPGSRNGPEYGGRKALCATPAGATNELYREELDPAADSCATMIRKYLSRLARQGCARWPIYVAVKQVLMRGWRSLCDPCRI